MNSDGYVLASVTALSTRQCVLDRHDTTFDWRQWLLACHDTTARTPGGLRERHGVAFDEQRCLCDHHDLAVDWRR
jgi:hypothetical protein